MASLSIPRVVDAARRGGLVAAGILQVAVAVGLGAAWIVVPAVVHPGLSPLAARAWTVAGVALGFNLAAGVFAIRAARTERESTTHLAAVTTSRCAAAVLAALLLALAMHTAL